MILWQKQASKNWLVRNEQRLEQIAGPNLAIIERTGHARTLVQATCRSRGECAKLLCAFGGSAQLLPRNWLAQNGARQTHPPIRVGRHLVVVDGTTPLSKPNDKTHLVIPAAGAFGTGEHATTAMSLRLLEEIARRLPPSWRLLDAGTGTGILALAARRLGAREVLGIDIDGSAVAHARQNARLNHIRRAKFTVADLLRWEPPARYEIVTANLFSELLIATLPRFRRMLVKNGWLIVSGILGQQGESVVRALRDAGFRLEKQRRRGKWIALCCTRLSPDR
jgi:ribosomal protein L11 methyltransferase